MPEVTNTEVIRKSTLRSLFDLRKSDKEPDPLNSICVHLNGRKYTVLNPDPLTSLNEWIRSQPGHKGMGGKVLLYDSTLK